MAQPTEEAHTVRLCYAYVSSLVENGIEWERLGQVRAATVLAVSHRRVALLRADPLLFERMGESKLKGE